MVNIIYQFMGEEDKYLPTPTKVKSSNPKDSIGQKMTDILDGLTNNSLNNVGLNKLKRLYHYAHFAQLVNLCKCIAAYLSARVYFQDGAQL